MEQLTFYGRQIDQRHIDRAAQVIADGGIVIYPTDTIYALGCDALNNRAIERLCRIKGLNPEKQLLSIVCSGISQAAEYARIDNHTFKILKEHLPGPFTFILQGTTKLPKVFRGRKSVGIRVPDQPVAQALCEAVGHPILSTSVTLDDEDELINPESIAMHYDAIADLMLMAGEGSTIPSTIVDLTDVSEPEVIRQGLGEFD
ncbi:MAG: L-threonylcarbamoyladenylate synthase [Muribaculaceae bacterium]